MAETQDWKDGAQAALSERLEDARRRAATFAEAETEARDNRLAAEIEEDEIIRAAEILGVDLGGARVTISAEAVTGALTAGDVILSALREAFPKPMKAAQLRQLIEERLGRAVHQKTTGMTLYRLGKDELVRREGHNWFAMSGTLPLEQQKGDT